jgi:WD40 repeat protein
VNGQVKLWQLSTREELATLEMARTPEDWGAVSKLVFSPDGRLLAGGRWPCWSGEVVLWDSASKQRLFSLKGPAENVTTIAFSPDGRLLATGGMSGGTESSQVFLWDLHTRQRRNPLKGHVAGIVEVAFTPDGKTLATGGYDTVKLWNVATEQEIASLPVRGTFRSLCFSPDGRTLAVGYLTYPGHHVRLYHAPSLEEIAAKEKVQARATP